MTNLVNPFKEAFGAPVDPPFSTVSLLLHMEGANAGTSFTDSSSNGHTVTPTSVTTSTTQFKFGATAGKFATAGGGANQLSIGHHASLDFPTGDFSHEAWIFFTTGSINNLILQKATGAGFYPWQLLLDTSNHLVFRGFDNANVSAFNVQHATSLSTNTWYFVQARRSVNAFNCAVNGVQAAGATFSGTLRSASDPVLVGNNSGNAFVGYIDEMRITKGVAVPFTNRGSQFPDS